MNAKYRKMIEGLVAKNFRRRKKDSSKPWYLYMLRCTDGNLYTGITNDVAKRLQKHQSGRAAHFTKTRLPVELIYQEPCVSRSAALQRELQIKGWPRTRKLALATGALS